MSDMARYLSERQLARLDVHGLRPVVPVAPRSHETPQLTLLANELLLQLRELGYSDPFTEDAAVSRAELYTEGDRIEVAELRRALAEVLFERRSLGDDVGISPQEWALLFG